MTRGLRNNNPGNIRLSNQQYQGEVNGTDTAFKAFKNMAYGYRAIFVVLGTYLINYKLDTIEKIIQRWAPENENDTQGYITAVEKWSGVPRDKALTCVSGADYIKIVGAMSQMENGAKANMSEVEAGFKLQSKIK